MLNRFRAHHKKVMWALAIVIIPAFVLWGGIAFLKEKNQNVVAKIGGHVINVDEFRYYTNMAQLYFSLLNIPQKERKITNEDIVQSGLDYILLLWKANKDKINIDDAEVLARIKIMFFGDKPLNRDFYERTLRRFLYEHNLHIETRAFEEYIRNFLKIDKLYEKYIKVVPSEDEVKKLYKRDTQKAKIAYIFISYDKFKEQLKVTQQDLEKFYNTNKTLFKKEASVKIKYALINKDAELLSKINNEFKNIKSIDDLKSKFSLDIKETDFIGKKDPIEGLGWQPALNQLAFSLKKNKVYPPIETSIGYIMLQKIDEKPTGIPMLSEIKNKVEQKIKEEFAKKEAANLASTILSALKDEATNNLKKIAEQKDVLFKETGDFKYYDYIEGLGLNENVSKIIFSLKKDEIYPYPLFLSKGVYIIQLKEKSVFDKNDFAAKKDEYFKRYKRAKEIMEKLNLLSKIKKESKASF